MIGGTSVRSTGRLLLGGRVGLIQAFPLPGGPGFVDDAQRRDREQGERAEGNGKYEDPPGVPDADTRRSYEASHPRIRDGLNETLAGRFDLRRQRNQ